MSEIKYRQATLSDLEHVTVLVTQAYAEDRANIPDIPDVTQGLGADIETGTVFVAVKAAQIAGVVVLAENDDALMIVNVAVSPQAQGLGVGKGLMQQAEDLAHSRGKRRLSLRTHAGLAKTRAIYRRLGWIETGQRENVISMEKTL
ncbi:MAG: GNAT family N-acetyltransferase [Pseudomonadota bacterium]